MTNVTSPAGSFGYLYFGSGPSTLVSRLLLPNGARITNSYDSVARLLSTKLVNSGLTTLDSESYAYNQTSQRTAETNTAGDFRNYGYDNAGELLSAVGKEAGGTTNRLQEQFGYAYDGAGNLNYRTNNGLLSAFNVNNLNELTTLTNGGRLTVAGTTTTPATSVMVNTSNAVLYADATFASTNQPWVNGANTYTAIGTDSYGRTGSNSVTVNLQATNAFVYDLNGNLLSDTNRNFAYDDENQLISVWGTNVWRCDFVYDGKLRRKIERDYSWNGSSWQQTNEIHFIYDGNVVIQERNASNIPLVTYTRGNDLSGSLQGAGGIGGLLARTDYGQEIPGSAPTAYFHADGNGNIIMLIYTNQIIAAKYLYDPFGNTLSMSGPLASLNTYRFSSKEWNNCTGLYYYLYRYYDPIMQRWSSRDRIGERGGVNLYAASANDLVNHWDFLGLSIGTITLPEFKPVVVDNGSYHERGWSVHLKWMPPTSGDWANSCECKPCQRAIWVQDYAESTFGSWTPDVTESNWHEFGRAWGCAKPPPHGIASDDSPESADLWDEPHLIGHKSQLWWTSPYIFKARSYVECIKGRDAGKIYGWVIWGYSYTYDSTPVVIGPIF